MYRIILCSFALLSLTACALGVVEREALTPAPPTTAEPTSAPPTTAVLTAVPTTITQPTPTTPPEPEPVATPEQIIFAPGATSATIEGSLDSCYDSDTYRLNAMAGQTMHVAVTSPEYDVIVTVTRLLPDGTWDPLVRSHFLVSMTEVFLPATGSYDIGIKRKSTVTGDCDSTKVEPTNYTLKVEIPPLQPTENLTLEILKNADYKIPGQDSFQLEDGIHYLPPQPPDDPPESWVITLVEPVAFGDVDGDGDEDGVVILNARYGGTGAFKYLAVVVNHYGQPRNVATTFLGDRTVINAIEILTSGEIQVDAVVHGPEDPLCCPTQFRTLRFQLVGGELVDLDDD